MRLKVTLNSLEVNVGVEIGDEGGSKALLPKRIHSVPLNVNTPKPYC